VRRLVLFFFSQSPDVRAAIINTIRGKPNQSMRNATVWKQCRPPKDTSPSAGFPGPLASVTGGAAGLSLTTSSPFLLALRSAPFAADDVRERLHGNEQPRRSLGPLVSLVAPGVSENSFGGSVGALSDWHGSARLGSSVSVPDVEAEDERAVGDKSVRVLDHKAGGISRITVIGQSLHWTLWRFEFEEARTFQPTREPGAAAAI
jgi:hypothetical protein